MPGICTFSNNCQDAASQAGLESPDSWFPKIRILP